jgi:hydrophobic/amphiphilic exporter-1 (mainly G- bacteria), HAE1 family
MNFTSLFINRPVTTTLIMLGILIFGIAAFMQLPVSDLPNVDYPAIQVSASLPGASPETMAAAVATPLEKQFSTIAGIDSMTSTSTLGSTQITIIFSLSRSIDAAAQDVQAAIAQAQRRLPQNMPSPPTYQKVNPADQPILYLALTGPTLPMYSLDEYGQTLMAQRISMVSGVAQVQVYGSQKYAVRVWLNPSALAARGIGINEVADAVANGNVNIPTGVLYGPYKAITLEASGQLVNAEAYKPLVVAYRNGSPVRLGELGKVIDSVENNKTAAWYVTSTEQSRGVILAIQRQPGTNTVAVADAVMKLLPSFREQMPAGVSLNILFDRSMFVRESVKDVEFTLVLTLALVVLVIFLFLRNLSATVIPSLTLPMSIVATFAVMNFMGFSLDNLSLMALTLSVGFVVDDAIVMLENIFRHMEMGKPAVKAAVDGAKEISFTIVSMTLSLSAIFIPVLFMGGLVGRLFHEFAVTIGVAVLASGFIALSLTPMLSSRFLKRPETVKHGHVYAFTEGLYQQMVGFYERTLKGVLGHRRIAMIFSALILGGTFYLFAAIPKGFLPSEDRAMAFGFTEGIEGISFDSMVKHQIAVNAVLQKEPDIDSFMSFVRGGGNSGMVLFRLKPRSQRKLSVDQLIQKWRRQLSGIPGIKVYLQNPPPIPLGGRMSKSQYQYTLQSYNLDELYKYAAIMEEKIRGIPGLLDVTSDLQIKNPQVSVDIDRDKASSMGITAGQIEDTLYSAYGSRQISTILAPNNQYYVILELEPQYQLDPAALGMLYIRSGSGQLVPLESVAKLTDTVGPLSINHQGQLPAVTISFNLPPNYPLGNAVDAINRMANETLPETVTGSFQGTAQAFTSSVKGLGLLLILAIMVIYLVLGILYESFIHPLTILSALPFAGFGALITLWIFGEDLSIYAFVGIIMLVGLVKKNGIMMIDFAIEAQRKEGKSSYDAIVEASVIRFRPIMMTTMAALMAGLPIAIGFGAGAESRRPLGLAVVGGLLFSQSLTLYITPVFYLYMESLQKKLTKWFKSPREQAALA